MSSSLIRRTCHLAREVQGGALKMLCVSSLVGSNPTDGINEFNSNNCIKTYIYNRRITLHNNKNMNRNKLFNYSIQAFETERKIQKISPTCK